MSTQSDAGRTLVLMRHALADTSGASDHDRVLAPAGRDGARAAGAWLAALGVVPDEALVSDARRTHETWLIAADAAAWRCEPTLSGAVYSAGPDSLLDLMRSVGPDVSTLLVVGHNPTIAYVVGVLDDGEGDVEACTHLLTGHYPPGSATVFSVAGPWADLGDGGGTVRAVRLGDD